MTKLLALEASGDACSVAVTIDGQTEELFEEAPRGHAQRMLPMIDSLLNNYKLRVKDLDAIAFSRGPGAFTGLRIAAGVTQGLAFGAELPVIGVSTLQALALGVIRFDAVEGNQILSVLDARMGEIYCALYTLAGGECIAQTEEIICRPESFPVLDLLMQSPGLHLLGNGSELLHPFLLDAGIKTKSLNNAALPRACDVLTIAGELWRSGQTVSAEQAVPVYLRTESAWKKLEEQ